MSSFGERVPLFNENLKGESFGAETRRRPLIVLPIGAPETCFGSVETQPGQTSVCRGNTKTMERLNGAKIEGRWGGGAGGLPDLLKLSEPYLSIGDTTVKRAKKG